MEARIRGTRAITNPTKMPHEICLKDNDRRSKKIMVLKIAVLLSALRSLRIVGIIGNQHSTVHDRKYD